MIIDSSIIIAIFLQEPGYEKFLNKLSTSEGLAIAAPTVVESAIVLSAKLGVNARSLIEAFLRECEIAVLPFTAEHWPLSLDAYWQFGKGRHKAQLNYGDCLCYAVAQLSGEPLLFKGNDFAKTDVLIG